MGDRSSTALAVAVAAVAFLNLYLAWARREDSWNRVTLEIFNTFWSSTDDGMKRVRAWIAYDECYPELEQTLAKRLRKDELSVKDVHHLDDLDRFAALIQAYLTVAHSRKDHDRLGEMLCSYWLRRVIDPERRMIHEYFRDNFGRLVVEAQRLHQLQVEKKRR